MIEEAWLAGAYPDSMLEFLRNKANERKLRLFAVSYFRQLNEDLLPRREMEAIDIAERHADHLASEADLLTAHEALTASGQGNDSWLWCLFSSNIAELIQSSVRVVTWCSAHLYTEHDEASDPESAELAAIRQMGAEQAALLREIFGNPFRPVAVEPGWFTADVVALAADIYQEKAFDRMPILANALQDSGCENDELLNHLRSVGPHVRGCWALDLVLGKPRPAGATGNRVISKQR